MKEGRTRVEGEGRSLYFYDYENHLQDLRKIPLKLFLFLRAAPVASPYSPLGILRQALASHEWEKGRRCA